MPEPGHGTNQEPKQPEPSPAATEQDGNQDSDLELIDKSELQPQTQRKKSVTFHLPRRKPTVPVFKLRRTQRATRVLSGQIIAVIDTEGGRRPTCLESSKQSKEIY